MGLRTHKELSTILSTFSLDDPMTILDWLQQTPNAHLVGECFEVRNGLVGASKKLDARAHLLPMSDSTLLNFGLGIALGGECAVIEWPSDDLSSIEGWIQKLPESGVGALVIRVHVRGTVDWSTLSMHRAIEVWAVASTSQRIQVLQRALTQRRTIIMLESAASFAWHTLEGHQSTGEILTQHGGSNAHCVIVSSNMDAATVQGAVDILTEQGVSICWFEQHDITQLEQTVLEECFDVGRVVCVGLPSSWMSSLIQNTFWRLENEPLFCVADESIIVQAVYTTLES